ncbi:MAG: GT4 family glycosyltransferase PelF [Pseudomonadota bacterium]
MSDVCLVLEGTYPYVRGGVSAWVHNIIKGMPEIKFSILSIMPKPKDTRIERYELPNNVQSIINVYLHDFEFKPKLFPTKIKDLFEFFDLFYKGIDEVPKDKMEMFLLRLMKQRYQLDLSYAFSSRDFWNTVRASYDKTRTNISFLDFFWNYRFTFLPIMQVLKANIPPAPVYHTISTGYAGVLASLAKIKFNSNMIITEHGIYTKERRIEIAQASWLYEVESEFIKATPELSFFKEWWIKYFNTMSKLAYSYADTITTLYSGNKESEILDGADAKKIDIIPNGVNLNDFKEIVMQRKKGGQRKSIAYIGRIVPIKDVKTLIKACKIIVQQVPDLKIFLIGPQEEESDYYQECSVLIRMMKLNDNIVFTGHVDVKKYYPMIDLIILTSISEAQPLVILEANACGIPVVATDVGSCRELLEGKNDEDRDIGPSGIVCKFYSPEETAVSIMKLLNDDELYEKMSQAGIKRIEKYYNEEDMILSYRNLYEHYI